MQSEKNTLSLISAVVKKSDYSDADCRMTAFLLLDGMLCSESTESNYTGTYLMFDTEAIDNVDRYEIIKKNRDMFTTLYGEKRVTDGIGLVIPELNGKLIGSAPTAGNIMDFK